MKKDQKEQKLIRVEAQPLGQTTLDMNIEAVEQAFYRGSNENTRQSDKTSLAIFAQFLGVDSFRELCRRFLALGHGNANMKALEFQNWLVEQKKAPSTVNRRLSALNKLVKSFRFGGVIAWELDVQAIPVETYRDTSGPGTERFAAAMKDLDTKIDPISVRDRTILTLLHDGGLRRGELVSLDLEHYDPAAPCVWIKAKKRTSRVKIDLSLEMKESIEAWLKVRGTAAGPLFTNFDPAGKGGRLTGRSVARVTNKRGVGRPHGVRHLAVDEYAEATNGNIVEVMKFARHKDPKITMAYIDNLKKRDATASKVLAEYRKGNRRGPGMEPPKQDDTRKDTNA